MNIDNLPYSKLVNMPALLNVFSSTAASYKYLFFLSLLDILEETHFNKLVIRFEDILLEMLANAWFPHNYFKLSFGISDRIARELDRLNLSFSDEKLSNVKNSKAVIKSLLLKTDFTNNNLLDMVPYLLLSPFFSKELKGFEGPTKHKKIVTLAQSQFKKSKPFYFFSDDGKSIIMNPQWMLYFYENQTVLRSFISWNWLEYMQRRNPSVPNLQLKLFPPSARSSLNNQTAYWKQVLEREKLFCIFSGNLITAEDLSIDHFLPWSFVAHDQLWNLIPVSRSINSSKSNNLPSMERYFDKFVDLQYRGLQIYRNNPGKVSWNKVIEPYLADLRLNPGDLMDRGKLGKSLRNTIGPLSSLAAAQGFCEGWVYG